MVCCGEDPIIPLKRVVEGGVSLHDPSHWGARWRGTPLPQWGYLRVEGS